MTDIANPDLYMVVGPRFVSTLPFLWGAVPANERIRMVGVAKDDKSNPHCWGGGVSTQFALQSARTAVTAPPLVGRLCRLEP